MKIINVSECITLQPDPDINRPQDRHNMEDSAFPYSTSNEPGAGDVPASQGDLPKFGAVDIVEAFTAMRHEWRGQSKESRAVADQIQAAVTSIQALESTLRADFASQRPDNAHEARPLALLLVETDHQVARAVSAIASWEANQREREGARARAFEESIAGMSALARWFARPLLTQVKNEISSQDPGMENPASQGLKMVLARLRRAMLDQGLERLDVQGQPFDPETMRAIGTVASTEQPAGYVAEQLSPAYRWQGKILRFADVRVAS